jgi:hypothetical protein
VEWGLAAVQGDWDAARQVLLLRAAAAEPQTPSPYGTPHPWAAAADAFNSSSEQYSEQLPPQQDPHAAPAALHFGSHLMKLAHPSSGSSSGPAAASQDPYAIQARPTTFQDGYTAELAAAAGMHAQPQYGQHTTSHGASLALAGSHHEKLAELPVTDSGQDEVEELLLMMGIR